MIIYVLWNDHLCTVKCRTSVQQSSTQILNIISARNCLQNVFSLFSDAYFSVRLLCISSTEALYKWPCAQIWVLWMYCIAFFLIVTLNFSVSALSKFWNSIILMNWWLLIARLLFSYLTEKRYCYVVKCCSRNMFVFVCFSASHLCWTSTFWGASSGGAIWISRYRYSCILMNCNVVSFSDAVQPRWWPGRRWKYDRTQWNKSQRSHEFWLDCD